MLGKRRKKKRIRVTGDIGKEEKKKKKKKGKKFYVHERTTCNTELFLFQ
jgi:hypothetical protein